MNSTQRNQSSLVDDIIARNFASVGGELRIGEIPARDIVAAHGTPLFIYDANVIRKTVQRTRQVLGDRFDLFYSIKANPSHAILQLLLELGCGFEIASAGELRRALQAGCPAERIVYAGPGKTVEEIELALQHNIGEIHAESERELARIAAACRKLSTRASVALRINPSAEAQGGAMRMGGGPAPFGIDEERMPAAVELIRGHPEIELRGLHLFVGTQILDYQVLLYQYRKLADLARQLHGLTGRPVETLDFGGGWGIPLFGRDMLLDLPELCAGLRTLIKEDFACPATASARCILEPGRFLVAEAGIYVCRVLDIKHSRGVTYLVTDGGLHHHLAATGNLGQTIKRNYPIALLNRLAEPRTTTANIVGPLCTPLDVLARKLALPEPQVGDFVGVFQSGAYARSASPLCFLSHRWPAEILVDGDEVQLAQPRGEW